MLESSEITTEEVSQKRPYYLTQAQKALGDAFSKLVTEHVCKVTAKIALGNLSEDTVVSHTYIIEDTDIPKDIWKGIFHDINEFWESNGTGISQSANNQLLVDLEELGRNVNAIFVDENGHNQGKSDLAGSIVAKLSRIIDKYKEQRLWMIINNNLMDLSMT